MEALSPQDMSFLEIENDVNHMHIGSVGIFEGPPPSAEELLEGIEAKLHLVPRYRQRVRYPPLRLGPAVWIDDPHFNLAYHVRRTALASPGGEDELRTLVGRVMSQQLDRTRPLWEMWVAEGLEDGRWALVSKAHHCMVDGVSATDLLSVLLDAEREPVRAPAPRWTPRPEPSSADLLAQPLARRLASPANAAGRDPRPGPRTPARGTAGAGHAQGHRGDARPAARRSAELAERADRSSPPVGLGPRSALRCQDDPRGARRHDQRRRAGGDLPAASPTCCCPAARTPRS